MVIGKLKTKKGNNNEDVLVGSIGITDMDECKTLYKSIMEAKNGKKYLKIIIVPCESDEYGNTHLIKTVLLQKEK